MSHHLLGLDALGDTAPALPVPRALTREQAREILGSLLLSVVAGTTGAVLWRQHPVLGFLGGLTAGSSAYEGLSRGPRPEIALGLGRTGAGILGSLAWKAHPALGFVGGAVAGGVAGSLLLGRFKRT